MADISIVTTTEESIIILHQAVMLGQKCGLSFNNPNLIKAALDFLKFHYKLQIDNFTHVGNTRVIYAVEVASPDVLLALRQSLIILNQAVVFGQKSGLYDYFYESNLIKAALDTLKYRFQLLQLDDNFQTRPLTRMGAMLLLEYMRKQKLQDWVNMHSIHINIQINTGGRSCWRCKHRKVN